MILLFCFTNKNKNKKMQSLNHDVQIQIFMYLYPEEIKSCYDCFSSILDELSSHIGFQIHCSTIVCNQTVSWFLKKKISLHLLHTKRTNNICITTLRNYKCHSSNDIPSILYHDNTIRIWHLDGERHRDGDQPAYIDDNVRMWYQNGLKHRDDDLPAVFQSDGTMIWYQYGKIHRDYNLPAVISSNGMKEWYRYGELLDRAYY